MRYAASSHRAARRSLRVLAAPSRRPDLPWSQGVDASDGALGCRCARFGADGFKRREQRQSAVLSVGGGLGCSQIVLTVRS
jgi:hypothetical protein